MSWDGKGTRETSWGLSLVLIAMVAALMIWSAYTGSAPEGGPEPVPCVSRSVMR